MARRVTEWEPAQAGFWNTLGVAHYRSGEHQSARAAFEKSMELNKGGDPSDWFFLAALDHHAGKQEEARRWFDRSVAWMEKNRGRDKDLDAESAIEGLRVALTCEAGGFPRLNRRTDVRGHGSHLPPDR